MDNKKVRFEDLPTYEIYIDEEENQGIRMVSLVSNPAIEIKGMYFSTDPMEYSFKSVAEKQIIVGPAMVPNKKILRKDENDNMYYVYFSTETIKQMVDKFLKNNNNKSLNIDHSNKMVDGFIQANWIVEDPTYDKSKYYGFNLPKGSWFIEVKIEDEDFWKEEIKENGKFGFSVEGLMGQKLVQLSKVSFDYDGTLSQKKVQEIAEEKLANGDEVYIVTKRTESKDVLDLAERIGIKRENVIFTNHKPKWSFIKDLNIDIHYDNVMDEVSEISDKTNAEVIKIDSDLNFEAFIDSLTEEEFFYMFDYMEFGGDPGLVHPNCGCEVKKGKFVATDTACEICLEAKKNWELNGAFKNIFGSWYSRSVMGEKASIGFKKLEFESYDDYPKAASENAKVALRWAEENGWGSCGTLVGKARANQLAKGEPLTRETISRMAGFERHRQNSQKELGDGCGRLMWLAWGGDAGVEWASRKLKQIDKEKFQSEEFIVEPKAGESEKDFISRCIGEEISNGKEQEQAAAICYSKWENK